MFQSFSVEPISTALSAKDIFVVDFFGTAQSFVKRKSTKGKITETRNKTNIYLRRNHCSGGSPRLKIYAISAVKCEG